MRNILIVLSLLVISLVHGQKESIELPKGGGVYDIDNIFIVTPKFHKEILSPNYHYGYGY